MYVHRMESTAMSSGGLTFKAVLLRAATVLQRNYYKQEKSQGPGTGEASSTLWPGRTVKGAVQSICHVQTLGGENRVCNHSGAYKSL